MRFSIPELLTEEHSLGVFLLVSVAMGGGAAWLAGRAIAATWRPAWQVALYMLILALAVRFMHFALFDANFLSPRYYLVDFAVCLAPQEGGVTPIDQEYPHYALTVTPEEFAGLKHRLDAYGIPTSSPWTRQGHGTALMYFRDPAGNQWELYSKTGCTFAAARAAIEAASVCSR